jgi:3'-phosphoadenosine 5'-phosphosulfate sulfotransferase (PAPS reductase)/FAD synthetase
MILNLSTSTSPTVLQPDSAQICSRCIYDTRTPGISFDSEGICNYCHQVEALEEKFGTGQPKGQQMLEEIIEQIKLAGKGKKYNCVIGISGGVDSSYLLFKAVEWGLTPLAVHYDNTWNSALATENIRKVTSHLNVDLHTYVIDNKEADDLFRSFFLAGVPELDASTDLGFAQVLRSAAAKYGIRYILEGHSFKAEGVSPIGKNYFDGKYIQSIHQRFGKRPLKTYPLMTFSQFMKWALIYRHKFIRPLWYIDYSKVQARQLLESTTGWTYYGGHHLENRSSAFLHTVYNPQKFGIDNRTSVAADPELVAYAKKRMALTDETYESVMQAPPKFWQEYPTYKKRFERLRPLFALLAEANLVPTSFYLKYCFPAKE